MSQIKHGRLGEGEEVVSKGRGQFRKPGEESLKAHPETRASPG